VRARPRPPAARQRARASSGDEVFQRAFARVCSRAPQSVPRPEAQSQRRDRSSSGDLGFSAVDVPCTCPYCGEMIDLFVDGSGGRVQRYVEDCSVCCRPIEVCAFTDEDGEPAVTVQRSDQ